MDGLRHFKIECDHCHGVEIRERERRTDREVAAFTEPCTRGKCNGKGIMRAILPERPDEPAHS